MVGQERRAGAGAPSRFTPRWLVRVPLTAGTVAATVLLFTPSQGNRWAVTILLAVLGAGTAWGWTASIDVDDQVIHKAAFGRSWKIRLAEVVSFSSEVEIGYKTIPMVTVRLMDRHGHRMAVRTMWWSGGRRLPALLRERLR